MQNKRAAILADVFIAGKAPADLVQLGHISAAHGIRGLVKIQTYSDQPQALLKTKTWWLKAPQGIADSAKYAVNKSASAKSNPANIGKQNKHFATAQNPVAESKSVSAQQSSQSTTDSNNKFHGIQVQSCNNHGQNALLAKFTNINDRNQAELLQFYTVWLARTDFPEAQTDEYYWVDLIGCEFYGIDYDESVNDSDNQLANDSLDKLVDDSLESDTDSNSPEQNSSEQDSSQNHRFLGIVNQVTENAAHAILDIAVGTKNENGEFIAKLDSKSRPVHVLVPFVAAHITDVNLQAKRIISNWPLDY